MLFLFSHTVQLILLDLIPVILFIKQRVQDLKFLIT